MIHSLSVTTAGISKGAKVTLCAGYGFAYVYNSTDSGSGEFGEEVIYVVGSKLFIPCTDDPTFQKNFWYEVLDRGKLSLESAPYAFPSTIASVAFTQQVMLGLMPNASVFAMVNSSDKTNMGLNQYVELLFNGPTIAELATVADTAIPYGYVFFAASSIYMGTGSNILAPAFSVALTYNGSASAYFINSGMPSSPDCEVPTCATVIICTNFVTKSIVEVSVSDVVTYFNAYVETNSQLYTNANWTGLPGQLWGSQLSWYQFPYSGRNIGRRSPVDISSLNVLYVDTKTFQVVVVHTASGCTSNVSVVNPADNSGVTVVGSAYSNTFVTTVSCYSGHGGDRYLLILSCDGSMISQYFSFYNSDSCVVPGSYDIYGQIKYSYCDNAEWRMLIVLILIVLGYVFLVIVMKLIANVLLFSMFLKALWGGAQGIWYILKGIFYAMCNAVKAFYTKMVSKGKVAKLLVILNLLGKVCGAPYSMQPNSDAVIGNTCSPDEIGQLTIQIPRFSTGVNVISSSELTSCDVTSGVCLLNRVVSASVTGAYGAAMVIEFSDAVVGNNKTFVNIEPQRFFLAPISTQRKFVVEAQYVTYMDYEVAVSHGIWCADVENACNWGSRLSSLFPGTDTSSVVWRQSTEYFGMNCQQPGGLMRENENTCSYAQIYPKDYNDIYIVGELQMGAPVNRYVIGRVIGGVGTYECIDVPTGTTTSYVTEAFSGEVSVTMTVDQSLSKDFDIPPMQVVYSVPKSVTDSSPVKLWSGPMSSFGAGKETSLGHLQWNVRPTSRLQSPFCLSPIINTGIVWGSVSDWFKSTKYIHFNKANLDTIAYRNISQIFPGVSYSDIDFEVITDTLPRLAGSFYTEDGPNALVSVQLQDVSVTVTTSVVVPFIVNASVKGCVNCGIKGEISVTIYSTVGGGIVTLSASGTFANPTSGVCLIFLGAENSTVCTLYTYINNIDGTLAITALGTTSHGISVDYKNREDLTIPWNHGVAEGNVTGVTDDTSTSGNFWGDLFSSFGIIGDFFRQFGKVFGGLLLLAFNLLLVYIGFRVIMYAMTYFRYRTVKLKTDPVQRDDFRELDTVTSTSTLRKRF